MRFQSSGSVKYHLTNRTCWPMTQIMPTFFMITWADLTHFVLGFIMVYWFYGCQVDQFRPTRPWWLDHYIRFFSLVCPNLDTILSSLFSHLPLRVSTFSQWSSLSPSFRRLFPVSLIDLPFVLNWPWRLIWDRESFMEILLLCVVLPT